MICSKTTRSVYYILLAIYNDIDLTTPKQKYLIGQIVGIFDF